MHSAWLALLFEAIYLLSLVFFNCTRAFFSFLLLGPPRPTWTLPFTLFITLLRTVIRNSRLLDADNRGLPIREVVRVGSDIQRSYRMTPDPDVATLMMLVPKRVVIRRVMIPVKTYGFKDELMRECEKAETGRRTVKAEWSMATELLDRNKECLETCGCRIASEKDEGNWNCSVEPAAVDSGIEMASNSSSSNSSSRGDSDSEEDHSNTQSGTSTRSLPVAAEQVPEWLGYLPQSLLPVVCSHRLAGAASSPDERIVLYFHGGGYFKLSPLSHRGVCMDISRTTNMRVLSVDYRLAPESPFPAALHDALATYMFLTSSPADGGYGFAPSNILFAGDSAGGGLCLALASYLRDNSLPLPAGLFLISPWVDLNSHSDSWSRYRSVDYLDMGTRDNSSHPARLYTKPLAQSWDADVQRLANHPYVSPALMKTTAGLPPVLMHSGECEVIRDDIVEFAMKAKAENSNVVFQEYRDMPHVFHAFNFTGTLEPARRAYADMGIWLRTTVWPQLYHDY
ncbi:hypothetical protein GQ42DRAFT_160592 [Ramicandelaber brevisporus]|nr:hypothetical protein GQ42DRAFT_160592 [Ramicandelaber brevisporus]